MLIMLHILDCNGISLTTKYCNTICITLLFFFSRFLGLIEMPANVILKKRFTSMCYCKTPQLIMCLLCSF